MAKIWSWFLNLFRKRKTGSEEGGMKIEMKAAMPEQFRDLYSFTTGVVSRNIEMDNSKYETSFQTFLEGIGQICDDLFPGLKEYSDEHIAEQIFLRERERKDLKEWAKYELYAAKKSFEWYSSQCPPKNAETRIFSRSGRAEMLLLRDMIVELMAFIDYARFLIKGENEKYGWKKRNVSHSDEIFHASQMLLKAKIEEHTRGHFAIRPTSIFLIRQAMELRIKNGLGIAIITDKVGKALKLPGEILIQILERIKKENSQDIEFPIKMSVLKKIFRWSNYYIHGGIAPYLWDIFWAQHILEPLFYSGKHQDIWSNYGAIKIKKWLYDEIENIIKEFLNNRDVIVSRLTHPEAIIIDENDKERGGSVKQSK